MWIFDYLWDYIWKPLLFRCHFACLNNWNCTLLQSHTSPLIKRLIYILYHLDNFLLSFRRISGPKRLSFLCRFHQLFIYDVIFIQLVATFRNLLDTTQRRPLLRFPPFLRPHLTGPLARRKLAYRLQLVIGFKLLLAHSFTSNDVYVSVHYQQNMRFILDIEI